MKNKVVIKEVLDILQKEGSAVVVGGYIRDTLINVNFNDVDIVTTCSFDFLKETFDNLDWTDKGIDLGICRTIYKGVPFEFSIADSKVAYQSKLNRRDFTINSFQFDGNKLSSFEHADIDLENRLLRPIEPFYEHLVMSPKTILRAFRFTSLYNFTFHPDLIAYIKEHKNLLDTVPDNETTMEIYKIINGQHVIKALYYMTETNLLGTNSNLSDIQNIELLPISNNIYLRMSYIDYLVKGDTASEFIRQFNLSNTFLTTIEKYKKSYDNFNMEDHKKDFPKVLILKRYQFNDDKTMLADFIKNASKK